tara:strand:+ start:61 stop:510 length:450 start_codon:yes stop_codon:yes gene_type:complete
MAEMVVHLLFIVKQVMAEVEAADKIKVEPQVVLAVAAVWAVAQAVAAVKVVLEIQAVLAEMVGHILEVAVVKMVAAEVVLELVEQHYLLQSQDQLKIIQVVAAEHLVGLQLAVLLEKDKMVDQVLQDKQEELLLDINTQKHNYGLFYRN